MTTPIFYSYTDEYIGDSTQLLYLRSRYYASGTGRFLTRDTWGGDANLPKTYNKWTYANANPIRYTDRTGLYAQVDCSVINPQGLKHYCQIANGDESDRATIDARWMFFNILANTSMQFGMVDEGYYYAGKMLKEFVKGQSGTYPVRLPSNTSFANDYEILRATKIIQPRTNGADSPSEIRPLLYVFLQDRIQRALTSCTVFLVSDDFNVNSRDTWTGPYSPGAKDTGWWGAFGHVEINAKYSNTLIINFSNFYYISTKVDYHILDQCAWFNGKTTPFSYPLASKEIAIPHEWEISLVNKNNSYGKRASMFNFTVDWSEHLPITLANDFSMFSIPGTNITNIPLK